MKMTLWMISHTTILLPLNIHSFNFMILASATETITCIMRSIFCTKLSFSSKLPTKIDRIREGRIEIQSVSMQSEAVPEIIHALRFNKVLRRNKRPIISAGFPKCQWYVFFSTGPQLSFSFIHLLYFKLSLCHRFTQHCWRRMYWS